MTQDITVTNGNPVSKKISGFWTGLSSQEGFLVMYTDTPVFDVDENGEQTVREINREYVFDAQMTNEVYVSIARTMLAYIQNVDELRKAEYIALLERRERAKAEAEAEDAPKKEPEPQDNPETPA
jgi:hypothetical protein